MNSWRSIVNSPFRFNFHLIAVLTLITCVMLVPPWALGGTVPVTTTTDTAPTATPNSLRWAIQQANSGACAAPCTITFSGGGVGTHAINNAYALDTIVAAGVTIDGYSAAGSSPNSNAFGQAINASLPVIVRGSAASPSTPGLWARGTDTVIQGLVLQNFTTAIYVDRFATGTKIYGNFIGTSATGTSSGTGIANSVGISFASHTGTGAGFEIGGTMPSQRNLISGNSSDGIRLGPTVSVSTSILGNYIGVNAAGTGDLGNGGNGVNIQAAVSPLVVGNGTIGNVISGNTLNGVSITSSSGHGVRSNRIGTNAAGSAAMANSASGMLIDGGCLSADTTSNVISGNGTYGVTIASASNISINNNKIGANLAGTAAIPNTSGGIRIDAGTNLLVGNGSANTILGSGSGNGVYLAGGNQHRILNNTIRSLAKGIVVGSGSVPNMIENNAISLNGIGIDLSDNGVTANDLTDSDTGGDNLQNYPTITSAVWRPGLPTTVNATINSSAGNGSSLFLELFKADASANAQGLQRLVTQCATAKTFTGAISVPAGQLAVGDRVVATASAYADSTCSGSLNPTTSADGTSEFSPAATVVSQAGDVNLSITKTDGVTSIAAGSALTYTIVVTNNGPNPTTSSTLTDTFPVVLTGVSWTCTASAGGSCGTPSGSGNISARSFNLLLGGTATFTVSATLSPAATGTLSNTATCAVGPGETDTITTNDTATDNDTITQQTDLAITKTDGVTSVTTGSNVTYTVVVTNNGPSTATGASVSDILPAELTGATWSCVASGGSTCAPSGSGNLSDSVTLAPLGTATYTITATLSIAASGTLSNTASVAATSAPDPIPGNNSATDIDTIVVSTDLAITKTDGVTTIDAGAVVTYTIVVTNNGPAGVTGAPVTDAFPASLTGVTWACIATAGSTCGAPSGSGDIATTADLLSGGSATFTASGTLPAGATGTLTNTASVAAPAGWLDPNTTDNSATDTDTIVVSADLAITKTDGVTTVNPGTAVNYVIVVTNNGSADISGAPVSDTFPAELTGVNWTCSATSGSTCGAGSGSGNIATTVNLLVGGSATFTVTGMLSADATGMLTNTASVAAPAGGTDPNTANNSATDTDTIVVSADLSIAKTDGVTTINAGTALSYSIVVTNNGPAAVSAAPVTDTFPATIGGVSWTCSATSGSICGAPSGSGTIAATVNLLSGGSATFATTGTLSAGATGTLTNTASVAAPAGGTDPNTANNSATDSDTIVVSADLAITKTDGVSTINAGSAVSYSIVVTNNGPADVSAAPVTDTFPATIGGVGWTCSATSGSICGTPSGSGNIATTVNLFSGGSATFAATGTLSPAATGTLTNAASVAVPTGVTDSILSNNSATDSDTIAAQADVGITKSPFSSVIAGATTTYTITVTNAGPSNANGISVVENLLLAAGSNGSRPVEKRALKPLLAGATWTCSASPGSSCAAASGSGDINTTVNLLSGGTATFNISAPIAPNPSGTLSSTTTVTVPTGVTDPTPTNNVSSISAAIVQQAALSITKTNSATTVDPLAASTWIITVTNGGPSNAPGVVVKDLLPAELTAATWTCAASSGSACPAGGSGDIYASVDLLAGGSATFTLTAFVSLTSGSISNTAALYPPTAISDPSATDNSATDTDTVIACPAEPQPLDATPNDARTEVTFTWSDVGAALYELWLSVDGGGFVTAGSASTTQLLVNITPETGTIAWYVVAVRGNCVITGPTSSVTFEPDTCEGPDTPLAAVVGSVNSAQQYTFFWFTEEVEIRFEYAESNAPDMTGAIWVPTTSNTATFVHENASTVAVQYCYAVRAFRDCPTGAKQSDVSKSVCVSVLPAGTPNGNIVIEDGDTDLVSQIVRLCSDEYERIYDCSNREVSSTASVEPQSGPTVTLGSDKTWINVTPQTTTVPPTGTNVTITSNPGGLPTGTNTGTIIATSTAGQTSNVPFSVNVVTPVSPQGKTVPPANALIIPAVAHVSGVNSRWQSDIRMTNTSLQKIAYDLTFTPSGEDGSSVGKKTRMELNSGETKALDDIVKHWYGLGTLQNGSNGVLEIRPVEFNGKTEDASFGFATVASSRTYNTTTKGTYGQWIPAIPFANFIGRGEDGVSPILSMQQIAQSLRYRTNLGVVEGAGQPVTVQFTVFNSAGTKLTDFTIALKAMEHQQLNSILASKGITLEDGRIEAQVISGDGRITTYASVVDSGTDDPLLVPGIIAMANQASRFVLPGIADFDTGRNHWRSDTRIFNPGTAPIEATVIFYEQNEPSRTKSTQLTIEPGQVRIIDDTLRTLFGSTNVGGALHIVTPANTALVATSRTYDQQTEGTFGQYIPAVTANDAVSSADRALEILQVEQSDRYRTNLGLAEVTGSEVTVEVTAIVPDSTVAPKLRLVLEPYEFTQLNNVLQQMNLGIVYNGRLTLKVVAGDGRLAAYGSIIDQQTQDPTYVPAQ
jgi:uncharacterized repeat protein (TIGR01451 family)